MNRKRFVNTALIVFVIITVGVVGYFILSNQTTQPETSGKVNPLLDTPPVAGLCAQSYPKIGTFNEIIPDSSGGSPFTQLSVGNTRVFDTDPKDSIVSIDKYEKLVRDYIENKDQFSGVPKDDERPNEIKIFTEAIEKINLQKGEIIINGPQFFGCGYGFIGKFTLDGKPKHAVVRDNFADYSYKENTIQVEPGEQTDCGSYTCTVKADFKVNKESFTLSIGESYELDTNPIKSITLLYASVGKEVSVVDLSKEVIYIGAPPVLIDLSTQVIYIIEFK